MKIMKKKKGQNVAEYAILIALVVAAFIGIQRYVTLALQARTKDAASYLVAQTDFDGNTAGSASYDTLQYVPYYQDSQYATTRQSDQSQTTNGYVNFAMDSATNVTRAVDGYQAAAYNATGTVGNGMRAAP